MLLNQVNSDPRVSGHIEMPESTTMAPITATPSVLAVVGGAGLAKAAGAAVGAGAVAGAAYAAYRAVAN